MIKFWDKNKKEYVDSANYWIDEFGGVWWGFGNNAYGYDLSDESDDIEAHFYINDKDFYVIGGVK